MAKAAVPFLGARLRGGLVAAGAADPVPPLETVVGGHPTPTSGSEQAGRGALAIAKRAEPGDLLLVLLSGGASALMSAPAKGLTLEDKQRTTEVLLRSGADIQALNTVRKHLSAIKGGRLAASSPARCHTLAISDVVSDDLSVIGSGPTVPDATTFEDALDAVRRFGGLEAHSPGVVSYLRRGHEGGVPETPKPGDERLSRADAAVIGSRHDAITGAAEAARAHGYQVVVHAEAVVGEAGAASRARLRQVAATAPGVNRPLCVISSGETTVRVTGSGRGGRNQEFALAAVEAIGSLGLAAAASVGTDGVDGPTDAAGAMVDSTTAMRAQTRGLNPSTFLSNNDAYTFFAALGDLIRTGPTGTNVGDLQIFLLA